MRACENQLCICYHHWVVFCAQTVSARTRRQDKPQPILFRKNAPHSINSCSHSVALPSPNRTHFTPASLPTSLTSFTHDLTHISSQSHITARWRATASNPVSTKVSASAGDRARLPNGNGTAFAHPAVLLSTRKSSAQPTTMLQGSLICCSGCRRRDSRGQARNRQ